MAPTVKSFLPSTRSGRTLSIALSLLGVGALVQLLILAGYLIRGGASSRRAAPESTAIRSAPGATGTFPAVAAVSPTIPVPTPAPASTPEPPAPARPTPAPALRPASNGTDLLEQARQLRTRGDMNSALARLREAQVAEPENPQIVAEMALTWEAMQVPDRAFEQWQRLYNMGEGVGALFNLAQYKIQNVPAPAATPAATGNPAVTGAAADGSPFPSQSDAVLKLTDIQRQDLTDPTAEQKISLRIVVKNRPGTVVDPMKVRILTFFYDLVDGDSEVLTDAQTAFEWLTPKPINWANDKSEILQTIYYRPKTAPPPAAPPTPEATPSKKGKRGKGAAPDTTVAAAASPTPKPQVRTYLGYTVRLYYDRQLQDVQADPVRLLQKFPPPMTLSAD